MANAVVLKRRKPPAQKVASQVEDQRVLDETVSEILEGVREGLFDSYLIQLFEELDRRIQIYQDVQREPVEAASAEPKAKSDKLRTLKRPEIVFAPKSRYSLKGDAYAGVVMEFLGSVKTDPDDEGPERGRFMCVAGNEKVVEGKTYQLPYAAMGNLAASVHKEVPRAPVAKKITTCNKCGEDIEYPGKGRPSSICDDCRKKA